MRIVLEQEDTDGDFQVRIFRCTFTHATYLDVHVCFVYADQHYGLGS